MKAYAVMVRKTGLVGGTENRMRLPGLLTRVAVIAFAVTVAAAMSTSATPVRFQRGQGAVPATAASAATRLCDGYAQCSLLPYTTHGYQNNSSKSYWGMDQGNECTNYAAFVESTVYGVATPDYSLGNGGDWATSAAKHGVIVNTTPIVGSVAEWNDHDYKMGSDGHVAIVEQVGPDDSYIVVSQQNIISDTNSYDWEKIDAGAPAKEWEPWPDNFIHFTAWLSGSLIFPPGATAVQFDSIACPSKGTCVVVGSYNDAKSYRQGIIETLSDGKWRETKAPFPVKTSGNPAALLAAVSCASATYCVAVGEFGVPSAGLVEILSGNPSTWKPKPYETGDPLSSVACGAVGACVALSDINSSGAGNIIETLSNGEWKPTQATPPRGIQPADVGLDAVTCLNSHFCAAAGDVILPNKNETQGLVETLSGSSWVPFVAATQQTDVPLTSITCASTSLCAAAGIGADSSADNSSGDWGNVLATFSKGHLSDEVAPLPRGMYVRQPLGPPAIACAPVSPCIAGMMYYDSRGGREALVDTLSAKGWTPTQVPIPLPAYANVAISGNSAACATSNYCVLVGAYGVAPFIDIWSQGHWATVEAEQAPGGGFPLNGLNMVSCPTAGWCVAIGATGFVEQAPGD